MKSKKAILATVGALGLAASLFATAANASTNLLTNGSFETPGGAPIRDQIVCDGSCPGQAAVAGGSDIAGWTYNGVGFAIYESSGSDVINASNGNYYVSWGHLSAVGEALSQTVSTVSGVFYTLTYDITQQQSSDSSQQIGASITSVGGLNLTASNTNINNGVDGFTAGAPITFTGDGTLVTVTLTDLVNADGANTGIDNVSLVSGVAGVPEPATWALMLVGFGVVGYAMRKRVRTTVAFS